MRGIEFEVPHSFGFRILARKQQLKLDLDAQGTSGLKSLIAACIASGIETRDQISAEISDITGAHCLDHVITLLNEGENIHWCRCDDNYAPLPHNL